MDYQLDQFGLDEPFLDDTGQQNIGEYNPFLLDEPLDFFDDFNSVESHSSSSHGSTGNTINTSNDSSNQIPQHLGTTIRRDSSDESDIGIVDDISIPLSVTGRKRSAAGSVVDQHQFIFTDEAANSMPPTYQHSIQHQNNNNNNNDNTNETPAVIKVEPLPNQYTTVPVTFVVEEQKPSLGPKPCLMMPNGSLMPISWEQIGATQNSQHTVQRSNSVRIPALPRQKKANDCKKQEEDEMTRAAKRQMRIIKNREAASQSRQRQKQYLESLEEKVKLLAQENEQMKRENDEMKRLVEQLHVENIGLRGKAETSSSVSSSLGHCDDTLSSSTSPESPVLSLQSQLVEEPVPKKVFIKPIVKTQPSAPNSPPVITIPVKLVKQTNEVAPQQRSNTVIYQVNKPLPKVTKPPLLQQQQQQHQQQQHEQRRKPILVAASRPRTTVLLVFSLMFALNSIPFASKLFHTSSDSTPINSLTELSYVSTAGNNTLLNEITRRGRMNQSRIFESDPSSYTSKRQNELMIIGRENSGNPLYEFDVDDEKYLQLLGDGTEEIVDTHGGCNLPPTSINATHSRKIVNALSKWASLRQHPKKSAAKKNENPTSGVQLYRRRNDSRQLKAAADSDQTLAQYEKLADTIRQRNDTFYMLSFHIDQMIFPALHYNNSTRPKMSLVLPALFSLNETAKGPAGSVALMQIECEITDMRILHLAKHLIPLDILMRQMRSDDNVHAESTQSLYKQWLFGNNKPPSF